MSVFIKSAEDHMALLGLGDAKRVSQVRVESRQPRVLSLEEQFGLMARIGNPMLEAVATGLIPLTEGKDGDCGCGKGASCEGNCAESDDSDETDDEMDESLYLSDAEVLEAVHEEVQENVGNFVAGFVTEMRDVGMTEDEINVVLEMADRYPAAMDQLMLDALDEATDGSLTEANRVRAITRGGKRIRTQKTDTKTRMRNKKWRSRNKAATKRAYKEKMRKPSYRRMLAKKAMQAIRKGTRQEAVDSRFAQDVAQADRVDESHVAQVAEATERVAALSSAQLSDKRGAAADSFQAVSQLSLEMARRFQAVAHAGAQTLAENLLVIGRDAAVLSKQIREGHVTEGKDSVRQKFATFSKMALQAVELYQQEVGNV